MKESLFSLAHPRNCEASPVPRFAVFVRIPAGRGVPVVLLWPHHPMRHSSSVKFWPLRQQKRCARCYARLRELKPFPRTGLACCGVAAADSQSIRFFNGWQMTGSKAFSHLRISRGCPLPFAGPPGRFQNSAEHLRFRIRLTANLFASAGFHLLQIRRINLPPCSKFLAASCRCGRPARGKSGTEIPGKSELHCTQSVCSCFFLAPA